MNQEAYPDALPAHFRLHWYELERVLGQGGFGITYLAHDSNLDLRVAIKEYLPSDVAQRRSDASVRPRTQSLAERYRWGLGRFVEEARTLARFDHPNIVRVQSVFEANDTAYMVMRFEEGENLATLLERRGTLGPDELMRVLLPIIDGLEHVHGAGFIHRDIKPENIHIRSDGSPVLLDFGSARLALGRSTAMTVLVAPGYAPLEQYHGEADTQGPWTDIYGLAATAYRAITGVPPQDAVLRAKGRLGSTTDTMVPAATLGRDRYPAHILAAIDHGLQLAEADRPQSLAQWRRELLGDAAARAAPAPRPAPAPAPTLQPARRDAPGPVASTAAPASGPPVRRPLGPWAGAAALGLALVLVVGAWKLWPRSGPAASGSAGSAASAPAAAVSAPGSAPVVAVAVPPPPAPASAPASATPAAIEVASSVFTAPPGEERARKQAAPSGPTATAPRPMDARAPAAAQERKSPTSGTQAARTPSGAAADPAPRARADTQARAAVPEPVAPSAPAVVMPTPPAAPAVAHSASAAAAVVAPALPDPFVQAEDAYRRGDYAGAYKLVRPLGDKGAARAQELLGRMAEEGRGVVPNAMQAYIWYSLAAQRGQATARTARERVALKLQPAEIAQAERLVQNWQPQ